MPLRPPWQKMVKRLQAEGFQSPYLEQLHRKVDVEQSQQDLEKEIAQEVAGALGRSENLLLVAMVELEWAGREHDLLRRRGAPTTERAQAAREYNERRKHALSRLRDLQIHREAVGMRRHHMLRALYPIPGPRPLD